ncbi:DUF4853 domain-containing protein [Schaalia vaccimaxillae]|uniref:DUF4853 domain-containing protein n=1 Tax=Schaalia vaccimaxillae TaxID=183916 RepID=UPI0003B5C8B5|nr:DUF4853 domain-containing protein [Schaalia vaccimaxillae]
MKALRIGTLTVAAGLVLSVLGGCAFKEDKVGLWSSDGEIDFEQRQTIEDYQTITEPLITAFVADLAKHNGGLVRYYDDPGLGGCGRLDVDGWVIDSRSYRLPIVDEDTVIRLADKHLVPAGLTVPSQARSSKPNDNVNLTWKDTQNGGYVSVTLVPDHQGMSISYASGCRPSDGTTTQPDQFHPNRDTDSAFTNLTVEVLEE